ncbi:MAG TPA: hypothetical protein VES60_03650 [Nakamurella sp.]|nr:hypothetical protein [Nakamurella sp.]
MRRTTAATTLYGSWGPSNGEPVTGLADARQINTTQITQDGDACGCPLQNDVNLSCPTPVATTCVDRAHQVPASGFADNPFTIDDYVGPADRTCAPEGTSAPVIGVVRDSAGAVPGGCTRDLVHRFYQQLVAARARIDTTAAGAHAGLHSVVDANGFPASYPLYTATGTVNDGRLTQAGAPAAVTALACGDYAVNTIQPASPPTAADQLPLIDDTRYPNIGEVPGVLNVPVIGTCRRPDPAGHHHRGLPIPDPRRSPTRMASDADPWADAIRLSTAGSAGTALDELLPQLDRQLQAPARGTS